MATPGVTALTHHLAINDDSLTATGPGGPADVEPDRVRHRARRSRRPGRRGPLAAGTRRGRPRRSDGGGARRPARRHRDGRAARRWPADAAHGQRHRRVVGHDRSRTCLRRPAGHVADAAVPRRRPRRVQPHGQRLRLGRPTTPRTRRLSDAGFPTSPPPANVARLGQVGPIPWLLAGFLCLFAAAGLLHAVLTSLRRRKRDLAIARALGLGPRRAARGPGVAGGAHGRRRDRRRRAAGRRSPGRRLAADRRRPRRGRRPPLPAGARRGHRRRGRVAAAVAISLWPRSRAVRPLRGRSRCGRNEGSDGQCVALGQSGPSAALDVVDPARAPRGRARRGVTGARRRRCASRRLDRPLRRHHGPRRSGRLPRRIARCRRRPRRCRPAHRADRQDRHRCRRPDRRWMSARAATRWSAATVRRRADSGNRC